MKLSDSWGFHAAEEPWTQEGYRAPLPVLPGFPAMQRGDLDEPHPPYVTAYPAWNDPGVIDVGIFDGRGYRVGMGEAFSSTGYAEHIYIGDPTVPEEWKAPLAAALAEIRAHWPDAKLRFRPDPDVDEQ